MTKKWDNHVCFLSVDQNVCHMTTFNDKGKAGKFNH